MPKETYDPNSGGGGSNIEPLEPGQYPGCVLEKIFAFRQKQKDEETGNEFMRTKLSMYWNSGYVIGDTDEPFYFTHGFMTFSFHERSNFSKVLEALSITEPGKPVEVEYELGGDYAGRGFDSVPIYEGTGPKKDSEVPVETLVLNGKELLGTTATLIVSKKPTGYNKIELVLPDAPKEAARPGPKRAEPKKVDAPVDVIATKVATRKDSGVPAWSTWRTRANAIKWAAALNNVDGSPAYQNKVHAEEVWEALWTQYQLEEFEAREPDFYRHWYRWHVNALEGKEFSFTDFPDPEDEPYIQT